MDHLAEQNKNSTDSCHISSAYGIEEIPKGIQFIDKRHCVYLAGSTFVILDLEESKIVQNISFNPKGEIKQFILSKNKKFAICNEELKNHSDCLFTIFLSNKTEKKQKQYPFTIDNTRVINMAISSNSEHFICQTGLPDWKLILFECEGLRYLNELRVINSDFKRVQKVSEVSFFPNDNKRIILVGNNLIKTYSISKNSLRVLSYIPCEYEIETHCWVNKNEVVAFDKLGNSYLIMPNNSKVKNLVLKNRFPSESTLIDKTNNSDNKKDDHEASYTENDALSDFQTNIETESGILTQRKKTMNFDLGKFEMNKANKPKSSIIGTSKGFILNNLSNQIFYYENERGHEYNLMNKIVIQTDSSKVKDTKNQIICEMSYYYDGKDELLVCFTNNKKIYLFDFSLLNGSNKTFEFQNVFENFHNAWITGIAMCLKKPIFATCSLDGFLNIWNYETNTLELKQQFNEELLTVSFHPFGLFCVLGTKKHLKYMSVSVNKVNSLHEFDVRSCNECKFSNGGHLIACIHGSIIQIFSTLSYQEVANIKAKQVSKVKKIQFTKYDRYLICCSMAGVVTMWDLRTFTPIHEILNKGISFMDMAMHPNQEWIFTISTDQVLQQFELNYSNEKKYLINEAIEPILKAKIPNTANTDEKLRCIECSRTGNILAVGTTRGFLKFYDINQNLRLIKQHRAHFSFITCISFTFNENYLISCSLDGLVVFWSINPHQSKKVIFDQNEDILINKNEYSEKLDEIKRGYARLKEANADVNFEYQLKQLKYNEKIRGLTNRFNSETLILTEQIKQQKDLENSSNQELNLKLENIIKENVKLIDNERKLQLAKNRFEIEKIRTLQNKINELNSHIEQKVETVKLQTFKKITSSEKEKKEAIDMILKRNENELNVHRQSLSSLRDYRDNYLAEIDNELTVLKTNYKKELCELTKTNRNLKIESTLLHRQIDSQIVNLDEYKALCITKEAEIAKITNRIAELENLEESMRKQISKNEKQAIESDSKINDLISINLDLEKYNCVHKFTIDELNKQVDPIRKENERLNQENNTMKSELQGEESRFGQLKNTKNSLNLKQIVFAKEVEKIKQRIEIKYEKCRIVLLVLNFIADKFLRKVTTIQPHHMIWFERTFLDVSRHCFIKVNESKKLSQAIIVLYSNFAKQFYVDNDDEKNNNRRKEFSNMFIYNTNNFIKRINDKRSYLEGMLKHKKFYYENKKKILANRIKQISREKILNENEVKTQENRLKYLENSIQILEFAKNLLKETNLKSTEELNKILKELKKKTDKTVSRCQNDDKFRGLVFNLEKLGNDVKKHIQESKHQTESNSLTINDSSTSFTTINLPESHHD